MVDLILAGIIALVLGSASYRIYKDKKKGNHCASCPYSNARGQCSHKH